MTAPSLPGIGMETVGVVVNSHTPVGNFRATDSSETASWRQYADAAMSAGVTTMQFNGHMFTNGWPAATVGHSLPREIDVH